VLGDLPSSNITAIQHMSGYDNFDDLYQLIKRLSLEPIAHQITIPVRIFHGGRDKTIPVSHAQLIADAVSGDAAVTIYERDHHNCLEHFDDIMAATLEFLTDPARVIADYQREVARNAEAAAAVERVQRQRARATRAAQQDHEHPAPAGASESAAGGDDFRAGEAAPGVA